MIAYLVMAWLKIKSGISFSLQQMFQLLQVNLFDRRELEGILKTPDDRHDDINNDYRLLRWVRFFGQVVKVEFKKLSFKEARK